MKGKLILTGVTNNPGRVVCSILSRNLELVTSQFPGGIEAVCRASSDITGFMEVLPEAKVHVCDLTDIESMKNAFQNGDTVIHMAGIHWSRQVADASAACGIRRLIVVHTCGIYSKYKAAGEEYRRIDTYTEDVCRRHSIALTILRPTMIYGTVRDRNMVRFIRMVDKLPVMPVVNGAQYEMQPVHYEDVGQAIFSALQNERNAADRAFILSGEKPILLREILMMIAGCLGKNIRFINCPFWIAYPGAVVIYAVTLGHIDMREKVQRLCEPRAYPHDEATAALDFRPRPFSAGIADEVKEYMQTR